MAGIVRVPFSVERASRCVILKDCHSRKTLRTLGDRGADWYRHRAGVAAVDRALSILDALTDDKVSLADLSKRTDLYKSTVLRLLKSLETSVRLMSG